MSKTIPHNKYKEILNQNTFGYTQKPQIFKPKQIIKFYTQKGNPVTKFSHFQTANKKRNKKKNKREKAI